MGGLQGFHNYTHLPWWASIILSTILMRGLLTFPLAVFQQYIMAKVENLKPEMEELVKELKKEMAVAIKKYNWDLKYARNVYSRSAQKIWRGLILRENCHPFKATVLLWVQIPLWVALSMSFRNMASMMPHQDALAQVVFMELSTGGLAWIPNLTDVDHSLILPIVMGVTNLIITEVNVLSRVDTGSKLQSFATNLFRFISVAIIPISATVPSCITLYWVTSSVCALVQNLALMHPSVKRACGVPIAPSEQPHPYQHIRNQFIKKLSRRNKQEKEEEEEETEVSQKEEKELKKQERSFSLSDRKKGWTKR
ncbi:hypothetical protein Pcinc_033627 [Petrolisthes cinctipes]|uniref:Membrane insertase YidC/Oxa/ALB C-terminal domain-containing protein n=1 Tax=Petrolisthes cinctipes TaxID=88211 RepID=A0AAE1ES19_PETCI|nr:hypothetical protein Pcinc_033627 [Petrolisthes cinctipes]